MRNYVAGALALMLAGAVLSGCSGATPSGAESDSARSTDAVAHSEPTEAATDPATPASGLDFPTCAEVGAVLGSVVDGLTENEENGINDTSDGSELYCGWLTPQTNGESTDLVNYGGFGIGISRDDDYTEESMESLGWNIQDDRVEAADAWALKVGGGYNPADQLDATGVQVVRDGIVVVLTAGGVALQDVPELAAVTNDWAIGAGVDLLELMG